MTDVIAGEGGRPVEGLLTSTGRAIPKTDILPRIGTPRQLAASTTTARVAFTTGLARVSIKARGAALRYLLGDNTVNASRTTSHYLEASERLEFDLDSTQTNIAVIIDNSDTATSIGSDASGANGFTGLITRLAIRTSAANDADLTLASAGGK